MGSVCGGSKAESGIFICPICHKITGYDKWQKRGDKWIFHKDNAWYATFGFPYDTAEKCWKETGGSNSEQWDKAKWVCSFCKFPSKKFLSYVPSIKRTPNEELELEREKNDFLIDKLLLKNIDNKILNIKAIDYHSELNKKNEIIKNLINQIKILEKEIKNPLDKIIAIKFESTDNNINTIMACKSSEIFSRVEERLYKEYPQYKNSNYHFTVGGNIVKRFKTMEENNIKNNSVILLNVLE